MSCWSLRMRIGRSNDNCIDGFFLGLTTLLHFGFKCATETTRNKFKEEKKTNWEENVFHTSLMKWGLQNVLTHTSNRSPTKYHNFPFLIIIEWSADEKTTIIKYINYVMLLLLFASYIQHEMKQINGTGWVSLVLIINMVHTLYDNRNTLISVKCLLNSFV